MRTITALIATLAITLAACSSGDTERSATVKNSTPSSVEDESSTTTSEAEEDEGGAADSTTTTATARPVEPAAALDSAFLAGNISPAFGAGDPGALSVVAVGAPDADSSTVPFVVRNNTDAPLYGVEATGRLLDGGQLVGSGSSQGVEPAELEPGHIGIGYVYIDADPTPSATVEITATGETDPGEFFTSVAMTMGQTNIVPGDFGSNIVGDVTNGEDGEVTGPVSVLGMCFDEAGTPLSSHSGFTDGDAPILPGATASYSIDLFDDPCPGFIVGSSGYSE